MRRQLQKLFYPATIAVIGASDREGSVGAALMRNLVDSEYKGKLYPVNLKHQKVHGLKCVKKIKDLSLDVDLAIIATPTITVPDLIIECGEKNIEAVVIITAGFKETGDIGAKLRSRILKNARQYNIRILGPHCLGFMNTTINLNASFASRNALKGNVAFLSQSGALCLSILDWSVSQNVGFSHMVSIGSSLDITFHDLIDFFGTDASTSCILIYLESLKEERAFISASRAYARSKPIIVLKAGKSKESSVATLSHTGSLAGNNLVFDAAFRRSGIIRVDTIAQLFHCAQALSMGIKPGGNRLAIVTNAGGPGILATDYLIDKGGRLPELTAEVKSKVNPVLSFSWSHKNPTDILNSASPEHYAEAVLACLKSDQVDGVLIILTTQESDTAISIAEKVAAVKKKTNKPILGCWMGEEQVQKGRDVLEQHRIPNYRYPERAVDVFLRIYSYYKNIELLYAFTPAIPRAFNPRKERADKLISLALKGKRTQLDDMTAKELLSYYDIPVNKGKLAKSETQAITLAAKTGYPVALKIAAVGISHKTDMGGVTLHISEKKELVKAYRRIMKHFKKQYPEAEVEGMMIEPMVNKRVELILGSTRDENFGPVITFGMGGIAVEVFKDLSFELPPMNMALAERMIKSTKVYELLQNHRNLPNIDIKSIQFLIIKFTYLIMDFPQISEIDINPYAVDEHGGVVLDANITLDPHSKPVPGQPYKHLVISPYPSQYEQNLKLKNGSDILLRPIRPEDEPLEAALFERLSKNSIYFRFFGYVSHLDHNALSRFTHTDYDREIALVAEIKERGRPKLLGVVRMIADPWNESAEYAIVVADDWQKQGLGTMMTDVIIQIARERGLKKIEADVLSSNEGMIALFKKKGFKFQRTDPSEFHVTLEM